MKLTVTYRLEGAEARSVTGPVSVSPTRLVDIDLANGIEVRPFAPGCVPPPPASPCRGSWS